MQAQTKFHDVEANEAQGKVKSISMSVMGMPRTTDFTEDGKMKMEGLTDAKYDAEGYIQECMPDASSILIEKSFAILSPFH